MLLLTFSRRAAQEMERRVGMVLRRVMKLHANQQAPALPWAVTFHRIGARLLRDCPGRLRLPARCTLHDSGDAEARMGMVRHGPGRSATTRRERVRGR